MSYRYRREENIDMISILVFANIAIPTIDQILFFNSPSCDEILIFFMNYPNVNPQSSLNFYY